MESYFYTIHVRMGTLKMYENMVLVSFVGIDETKDHTKDRIMGKLDFTMSI